MHVVPALIDTICTVNIVNCVVTVCTSALQQQQHFGEHSHGHIVLGVTAVRLYLGWHVWL
jgi:hypothetical protein